MHPDIGELVLGNLLGAICVKHPERSFLSLLFLDLLASECASESHGSLDLVLLLGLVDLTGGKVEEDDIFALAEGQHAFDFDPVSAGQTEDLVILSVAGDTDVDFLCLAVVLDLGGDTEGNERIPVLVILDFRSTKYAPDNRYIAFDHDLVLFIGLLFIEFIASSKFFEARAFA